MNFDPKTDLKLEKILEVPRSLIWQCWTTPRHIKNFFVPRPHKVTECEINLTPGGRFNTTFEVDGKVMNNNGVYLEIIENEKLVFTDAFSEGWKPSENPFMTAILLLEDAGENSTKYTAVARHRSAESRQAHEDMGFYVGWGIVTDQLVEYAKKL
ncbi:SRPBCC family protein [Rouxiella sp. WC2420]|uniref:SRPBCC family protein n=1 Tax=Rouxiella sp. WC2420 TaxID=3234145 RepID=A0AB39VX36_9GAMM